MKYEQTTIRHMVRWLRWLRWLVCCFGVHGAAIQYHGTNRWICTRCGGMDW